MSSEKPAPRKDAATVTPDGKSLKRLIDGVVVRYQQPIEDRRGEVLEVYRSSWGVHADPLVYVYEVRLKPGAIKGWVVHEHQDDRLFFVNMPTRPYEHESPDKLRLPLKTPMIPFDFDDGPEW